MFYLFFNSTKDRGNEGTCPVNHVHEISQSVSPVLYSILLQLSADFSHASLWGRQCLECMPNWIIQYGHFTLSCKTCFASNPFCALVSWGGHITTPYRLQLYLRLKKNTEKIALITLIIIKRNKSAPLMWMSSCPIAVEKKKKNCMQMKLFLQTDLHVEMRNLHAHLQGFGQGGCRSSGGWLSLRQIVIPEELGFCRNCVDCSRVQCGRCWWCLWLWERESPCCTIMNHGAFSRFWFSEGFFIFIFIRDRLVDIV